jgi:hypothetical protein
MSGSSSQGGVQRTISIVVGAAVVGLVGWMAFEGSGASPRAAHPDASASVAPTIAPADASAAPSLESELDAGLTLPTLSFDAGLGVMPAGAPRRVRIGVVLVSFAGAEGASPTARSKKDAAAIADRLSTEAKTDFHHARSDGDPGSDDDIGWLPRGVLDPRTEVSVFALAPGEVSDVLETPRGYWIVKRIE